MSSITSPQKSLSDAFGKNSKTAVSRYDLVSGFLLASVALVGFLVTLLVLLFLLNMEWDKKPEPDMFVFNELPGFENPEGVAEDFEEPGVEELAEVPEPQLADALEAVTDAVSTTRAALEAVDGTAEKMGAGKGLGDKRQSGLGGGGGGGKNPAEHWRINYSTTSKSEYAAQLDSFGIEIGSLSKDTTLIEYAFNLTKSKPDRKEKVRKDEKRIRFMKPKGHPALFWDKAFLRAANCSVDNRVIVNFYPNKTFLKLAQMEVNRCNADRKKVDDVRLTIFTVENVGGKRDYKLAKIEYY